MKPVVFDGHFGWLHPANSTRAVVLCAPPGHESQWLHATWLGLAEQFAQAGVSALRFDYLGSGDSLDSEAGRPAFEIWRNGIAKAAAFLRESVAPEHLSLCGLRLGAALAALAAHECGADQLILLAPVVSGRAYQREAEVLQRIWAGRTQASSALGNAPPATHSELLGYRTDHATTAAVARIDLRKPAARPRSGPAPAPVLQSVLIVQPPGRDAPALARTYRELGSAVDTLSMPDYTAAMQPAWCSVVPQATLERVAAWASRGLPPPHTRAPEAAFAASEVALFTPEAMEQTVSYGPDQLFGILCQPLRAHRAIHAAAHESDAAPQASELPVVLIANTGATSHAGEARFGVFLARSLARCGYTSLRIDVAGVGDSAACAVAAPLSLEAMSADVAHAAGWLTQHGHARVLAFGICSGAHLSLQAASLSPHIAAVLGVNLSQFAHAPGITLRQVGTLQEGSARAHWHAMLSMKKWRRVLQGHTRLAAVSRALGRQVLAQLRGSLARLSGGLVRMPPACEVVHAMMSALDARGVRVRLLYSPFDKGLDLLQATFGLFSGPGGALGHLRAARVEVLPHMDHEVLCAGAREAVLMQCTQLLEELTAYAGATQMAQHGAYEALRPAPPHDTQGVQDTESAARAA